MSKMTSVISLRDNYSAVMKNMAKQTTLFKKEVDVTKRAMDMTFKKEQRIRMDNSAANRAIKQTLKMMEPLRRPVINIVARTQIAMGQINAVRARLWTITKTPFTIALKVHDAVSPVLGKIGSTLSLLRSPLKWAAGGAAAGVIAAGGVAGMSLAGAMGQEEQQISMEHFIGINNRKMDGDQVRAASNQYIGDLRKNANLTPFETGEVMSAGTRAIGISAGNTQGAMSLLRLAEDMTALTPGKQLQDAIEALADLKTGETERMKEFGFKISQEDIKNSGGNMLGIRNAEGIALGDMFQGGSDKLGKSAKGLWSTITGTMKSGISDMGKASLEKLKPEMKKMADWLSSGGGDQMFEAGSRMMASMFQSVIDGAKKLRGYISERYLNNPEFQNMKGISAQVQFVFDDLMTTFNGWYEQTGKEKVKSIAADLAAGLGKGLEAGKEPIISAAKTIGGAIGTELVSSVNAMIKDHPILSGFAAGIATPGPAPAKVAVGAGVSALGMADRLKAIENKIKDSLGITKAQEYVDNNFFPESRKDIASKIFGEEEANRRFQKKAVGMRDVPRDNFPVLLHQHERVLTAQENRQTGEGGNGRPIIININHPDFKDQDNYNQTMRRMRADLQGADVNMP